MGGVLLRDGAASGMIGAHLMTVDAPPTLPLRLAGLSGTHNIQMTGEAAAACGGPLPLVVSLSTAPAPLCYTRRHPTTGDRRPVRTLALLALTLIALALAACDSASSPVGVVESGARPTPTLAPVSTPPPTTADESDQLTPVASLPTPTTVPGGFGPGTWRVGDQIAPGVYEAKNVSGVCDWARLSRLDADGVDVLFKDSTTGPVTIAILPTDAGFHASEGCGWWAMQAPPTPTAAPPSTPTPTPYPVSDGFRSFLEQHNTISSGAGHTCALRPDGSPVCWGTHPLYSGTPPVDEHFITVTSGLYSCALRFDGSPACWGSGGSGQVPVPEGEQFATISMGVTHVCALRPDGSPVCWGDGSFGQLSLPEGEQFMFISSGGWQTCALRPNGSVACWGNTFSVPSEEERFASISSGGYHVCALRPDGSPVCWGSDEDGQSSPPEGERFASIGGGEYHVCALRPDGSPVCWGGEGADVGQASPPEGERFAVGRVEVEG